MHPLYLIARREFLQRVRQKSFWIMLLLGPFFLMLVMVVPIGLAMEKESHPEMLFLDQTGELSPYFYSEPDLTFIEVNGELQDCYRKAKKGGYAGLIVISKDSSRWRSRFYQAGMEGENPAFLKAIIQKRITEYVLDKQSDIEMPEVSFRTASMTGLHKGEPDGTMGFVIGLFAAVLVLVFINQYSHMVLRGVVEEKQNRISELILTSVKPVHFISGKIAGIASVSFLQIFLWSILTFVISFSVRNYFQLDRFKDQNLAQTLAVARDVPQTIEMNSLLNAVSSINAGAMFLGFIFYFVFGYLLFSALFAVLGIAVGSDTDAQQMAIPFTLPLAIPVILLQYITENQDSGFTIFLSVFPLTSPTTMLLRLPFGVPAWEILVSAASLVLALILTAWAAAKVYRTGILMYGKKFSPAEIWRWIK